MKLCALVIGHKKSSPGAVNQTSGVTEFSFNEKLAMDIEHKFAENNEIIIQRIYRRTYQALPEDINALAPDFIISLHCNAFNTKATGTEVLYYHRSKIGKKMADILNTEINRVLGLKDRGIKSKSSEDRGGYLLRHTIAPCVIVEPFFIDNDNDFKAAIQHRDRLVSAYAKGIEAIADFN